MGISREQLYDPQLLAILPLGFCYPGTGPSGDPAPRRECAPQWRELLLRAMPRIVLMLVIGQYAVAWRLPGGGTKNLTETVGARHAQSGQRCRRTKLDITSNDDYHWWSSSWDRSMDTARLFQSGRSQAVRLPKEYRFTGTEVVVKHFGNGVLLLPVDDPWQTLAAGLAAFEPGFELSREQPDDQVREAIRP